MNLHVERVCGTPYAVTTQSSYSIARGHAELLTIFKQKNTQNIILTNAPQSLIIGEWHVTTVKWKNTRACKDSLTIRVISCNTYSWWTSPWWKLPCAWQSYPEIHKLKFIKQTSGETSISWSFTDYGGYLLWLLYLEGVCVQKTSGLQCNHGKPNQTLKLKCKFPSQDIKYETVKKEYVLLLPTKDVMCSVRRVRRPQCWAPLLLHRICLQKRSKWRSYVTSIAFPVVHNIDQLPLELGH